VVWVVLGHKNLLPTVLCQHPSDKDNMYKTLPGPIRPKEEKNPDHHTHSPLFGLNLNLNFSKMISSGVNFFDNLRKKTPSTPTHSNSESGSLVSSPSISSSCSADPSSPALCEETIEMTSFPPGVVALAAGGGTGAGHVWDEVGTHNPTWCDLCGEMIWGLYQTGAWQCTFCSYTSHIKCRDKIRLDCSASQRANRDSGSEAEEDEDDTDGMIQSLLLDDSDPEEEVGNLSTTTYATARADTLTGATMGTNTTRYLSFTSNTTTLVEEERQDEDQFHTLQDVAELAQDQVPSLLSLPPEELTRLLDKYNSSLPIGQGTAWDPEHNCFRGYIRVDMNLARPINVISGTRPPSIYNIMAEDTVNDRTLTTFYLPPGTEKALHITSQTTTQDVIRVLLKKFRVADNPHKYALYERQDENRRESFPRSKSLSRLKMRRLPEDEKPLVLAVLWGSLMREEQGGTKFVLQENDPGEIQWEQFSFPELRNFLLILDREEAWYKRRIHEKYETVQDTIHQLLQEKRPEPV